MTSAKLENITRFATAATIHEEEGSRRRGLQNRCVVPCCSSKPVSSSSSSAAAPAGKRPLEARFLPVGNPAAGFRIAGPELPASRAGTLAGLCSLGPACSSETRLTTYLKASWSFWCKHCSSKLAQHVGEAAAVRLQQQLGRELLQVEIVDTGNKTWEWADTWVSLDSADIPSWWWPAGCDVRGWATFQQITC